MSARTERKCLGGLPMRGSPLSKIDRGKIGKVSAGNDVQRRQMIPVALRTDVVGREHAGIAEAVIHLAKKSGASEDIVMGVVGIGAEPVALPYLGVGLGHQYYEAHRTGRRGDGTAVEDHQSGPLDLHHSANPCLRNAKPLRSFRGERLPEVDGACRDQHSVIGSRRARRR